MRSPRSASSEFHPKSGKVIDEDYRSLVRTLRLRAASALRQVDAHALGRARRSGRARRGALRAAPCMHISDVDAVPRSRPPSRRASNRRRPTSSCTASTLREN